MSGWNKTLPGLENMDVSENIHSLEFATSMEAWEKINEYFLQMNPILFSKGALANSGLAVCYNIFVHIRKAWVDPEFDYGRHFNYTSSKWSVLLNNYIDFNKLDLMRSRIRQMKVKYNQNYNVSYIFNNKHDNGKQCLIAATFSKRFQEDIPVITMILRASEITKRLMFDLLLVQRMAEYVYGPNQSVQLNIFATQMYGNTETLIMYDAHKSVPKIIKKYNNPWTDNVKKVYKKFKEGKEKDFQSFKVYFRSFKVVRPDLYQYKPLLAKDLVIEEDDIEYPENCISYSQRRTYKRRYLKRLKRKQENEKLSSND